MTTEDPEVLDAASSDTAVAEYRSTAAGLADLRERYMNAKFDVATTAGNKAARAARLELVTLRTTLEDKRKELKAPLLERAKIIDSEAKRITGEILALEQPIDAQIKADEARREAEREAKAKIERERIAAIQERIAEIGKYPTIAASRSAEQIEELIRDVCGIALTDKRFAEFLPKANEVHAASLQALREMHASALEVEAEMARMRAERERLAEERRQLEAQRAAEEARLRAEREAEEARMRKEREAEAARIAAEREAEEARIAEQRAAEEARLAEQRAQQEAELRRQREAAEAAAQAERERLEAERAEFERQQAAQKRIDDERRAAEEASRAAERAAQEAKERAERALMDRIRRAAPEMLSALRAIATSAYDIDEARRIALKAIDYAHNGAVMAEIPAADPT